MKKLFTALLSLFFGFSLFAQSQALLDKEKLFDLYQSQKYGEAAAYLKSVYGEENNDFKTIIQIGYCYLMNNENVEAEKFYTKAYQQEPKNLPVLFSLARLNTKRGNVDKAKFYYNQVVKIDSNNFSVYKLLAGLYTSNKDSLKLVYLLKASKINPQESDIAFDLADCYMDFQEREKAYNVLKVAISADTGNIILQKAVLPVANALKKYNEVILSGERILKVDADPNVIKDVARAYYYTKNYQKSINLFKLLELSDMQNEATLYLTALSYRAIKNYPMATAYTKRTIDEGISTNTAEYYSLLGLVYQESDKLTLANTAYRKSLEFKITPNIYYRMAVFYDTKLTKPKNALKYYNLYLKSKPNAKDNKEEIEFTKSRIETLKQAD
ncbi:tetratricopeptide repeat protein [Pedobacter jamesrossensis]|uniref:Tetratricopeptide repeat protein n=1 Tax=Pedobacter jamesrossensis TaxID=1908238 RepID=A0ABV8NJB7_9SPHI